MSAFNQPGNFSRNTDIINFLFPRIRNKQYKRKEKRDTVITNKKAMNRLDSQIF